MRGLKSNKRRIQALLVLLMILTQTVMQMVIPLSEVKATKIIGIGEDPVGWSSYKELTLKDENTTLPFKVSAAHYGVCSASENVYSFNPKEVYSGKNDSGNSIYIYTQDGWPAQGSKTAVYCDAIEYTDRTGAFQNAVINTDSIDTNAPLEDGTVRERVVITLKDINSDMTSGTMSIKFKKGFITNGNSVNEGSKEFFINIYLDAPTITNLKATYNQTNDRIEYSFNSNCTSYDVLLDGKKAEDGINQTLTNGEGKGSVSASEKTGTVKLKINVYKDTGDNMNSAEVEVAIIRQPYHY